MVDQAWLSQNLPGEKILDVSEFLKGDDLHLVAANNSVLSILGVVILQLVLGSISVPVPFVVSREELSQPIIGYNVIEDLASTHREQLPMALRNCIPILSLDKAHAVVNLVAAEVPDVKYAKTMSKFVLPPHSRCKVRCHTDFETTDGVQSVLFSPYQLDSELEFAESVAKVTLGRPVVNIVVSNPTNKSYVLQKGLVLGSVEAVSAVMPVMPREREREVAEVEVLSVESAKSMESSGSVENFEGGEDSWLPDVDLSHLSEEQRSMAESMLREEREAFCRNKSDHGDVPELQMDLKLTEI